MQIQEETRVVRYIEYDGKRFYEDTKGYWLGQEVGADGRPRRIRLHTYVWEKFNGPVPEGYDIHHIDHDPSNNEIENLVAMPEAEHHKLHMAERSYESLKHVMDAYVRPKAIEWHKSEEGIKWHKELYASTLAPRWDERITLTCQQCGRQYEVSPLIRDHSRFCSNRCKTAFRYHSGVDNEERVCPICGSTFVTNKYCRTRTCSKVCANSLSSRTKTEAHRRKK